MLSYLSYQIFIRYLLSTDTRQW